MANSMRSRILILLLVAISHLGFSQRFISYNSYAMSSKGKQDVCKVLPVTISLTGNGLHIDIASGYATVDLDIYEVIEAEKVLVCMNEYTNKLWSVRSFLITEKGTVPIIDFWEADVIRFTTLDTDILLGNNLCDKN